MIEGVHFKATLSLEWQTASPISAIECARYLAVLAEFEQGGDERQREQNELHAKLDLALLWLARTLTGKMPAPCLAEIGLEQVGWLSDQSLEVGCFGVLVLNLSHALPFQLPLQAQVQSCVQEGTQWCIIAALQFDDESLRDYWARTVFRRHRREIQQERGVRV